MYVGDVFWDTVYIPTFTPICRSRSKSPSFNGMKFCHEKTPKISMEAHSKNFIVIAIAIGHTPWHCMTYSVIDKTVNLHSSNYKSF